MLRFRGAPALSSFRIERLLAALRRTVPAVRSIHAEFVHFVDAERDLAPAEQVILEQLLDFDREAPPEASGQLLLTVPRPGTVSPWS